MTNAWKQQEGQIVDGRYRLVLYLGGSDHSAVFLTELPNTRERAAIKLIGSDPAEADSQLSHTSVALPVKSRARTIRPSWHPPGLPPPGMSGHSV